MGWTYSHSFDTSSRTRKQMCDNLWREGIKVLKSQMVGTVYYAALQDEEGVHAVIVLTGVDRTSYCNLGYKDMDETMDPCECQCPKSILALLTPTDNHYALSWRSRCQEYHKQQDAIRKAQRTGLTGYVVKTVRGYVSKVTKRRISFGGLMQYKVWPTREQAEAVVNLFSDHNKAELIPVVCEITRDTPTSHWN